MENETRPATGPAEVGTGRVGQRARRSLRPASVGRRGSRSRGILLGQPAQRCNACLQCTQLSTTPIQNHSALRSASKGRAGRARQTADPHGPRCNYNNSKTELEISLTPAPEQHDHHGGHEEDLAAGDHLQAALRVLLGEAAQQARRRAARKAGRLNLSRVNSVHICTCNLKSTHAEQLHREAGPVQQREEHDGHESHLAMKILETRQIYKPSLTPRRPQ